MKFLRCYTFGVTRAINNLYLYSPKTLKGKFKKVTEFLPEFLGKYFVNSEEKYCIGIKNGDLIKHNYFGYGTVKRIDNENIDIDFGNDLIRKFSVNTLIENNLIDLQ